MRSFAILCLTIFVFASPAWAAEPEPRSWALETGADYSTTYLFRGVDLLDDENVIVPRLKLTWGGLTAAYYGYYGDLASGEGYGEDDFSLDYTMELGKASLTLGALTYQFNGNAEQELAFFDTYEVYGILALDVPLSPTLSYNHDIDKVEGGYATFSLSHATPLGSRADLQVSGSVGFDFHYNNKSISSGTVNDVLLTAKVPVKISDRFSIYGQIQRSLAQKTLDDLLRDNPGRESVYGHQTVITAGAALTF